MSAFRILLINKALEQKEYNRLLSQKVENIMAYNEQLDMFVNTAKEMADKLKHAYKMGKDTGFKEGYKSGIEDAESHAKQEKKPEWIPVLVKYQEIPEWWRMKEVKSKLMGEVILVKEVSQEEIRNHISLYNDNKADYFSIRNEVGGKWYWNKDDLILYPDAMEVEMYASAKFAHNKGQKRTRK